MAELECSIEGEAVTAAERAGFLARKMAWPGKRNAPDHMFARADRGVVFIEFKRPGEPVPLRQKLEHDRLRKAGLEVHVCWTLQEALDILGI
jgi:hypothetical protein